MSGRSSSVRDNRGAAANAADRPAAEEFFDLSTAPHNPSAEFNEVSTSPQPLFTETTTAPNLRPAPGATEAVDEFGQAAATAVDSPQPPSSGSAPVARAASRADASGFDDNLPTRVASRKPRPADFEERSTPPARAAAAQGSAADFDERSTNPMRVVAAPPRAPAPPPSRPSVSPPAPSSRSAPRSEGHRSDAVIGAPYPPAASWASLPVLAPVLDGAKRTQDIVPMASSSSSRSSQRIPVLPWSPGESAASSSGMRALPHGLVSDPTGATVAGPRAIVRERTPPPGPRSSVGHTVVSPWFVRFARRAAVRWAALALAAGLAAWLGALVGRGSPGDDVDLVVPAPVAPQVQVLPLPPVVKPPVAKTRAQPERASVDPVVTPPAPKPRAVRPPVRRRSGLRR